MCAHCMWLSDCESNYHTYVKHVSATGESDFYCLLDSGRCCLLLYCCYCGRGSNFFCFQLLQIYSGGRNCRAYDEMLSLINQWWISNLTIGRLKKISTFNRRLIWWNFVDSFFQEILGIPNKMRDTWSFLARHWLIHWIYLVMPQICTKNQNIP